jgi:hypothetical protein
MKKLSLNFYNDTMSINYSKELSEFHKSRLHVNEKKYKDMATNIAKSLRYLKAFKRFALGFGHIDWYDNCNSYNVPYFVCTNENKRLQNQEDECYTIPKDWTLCISATFATPCTIGPINKFLEAIGLRVSDELLKQIRKALKDNKSFDYELE